MSLFPSEPVTVDLERLPLPALLARNGVVIATNQAYRDVVGLGIEQLNGRPSEDIIRETIHPADLDLLVATTGASPSDARGGQVWCRVVDRVGGEHAMRVEWRAGAEPGDFFVFLVAADPEAYGQRVANLLARTAGGLSGCATEEEILACAADALAGHGFTVTILLIDEASPYLKYGPQRSAKGLAPDPKADSSWTNFRPTRQLLSDLNPHFAERRAAFFQDGVRLVYQAYPERIATGLAQRLPSTRMVQTPLYVGEQAYGAIVVTGATLTPLVATALELFSELMGHTLVNVRLRREGVERERLAALGELSAVMAHEVRNPVGAILNAVAIARRASGTDPQVSDMVRVIAEEAARLEHLVNQLLEIGRPLSPRPRQVVLEDLIGAALELLIARGECVPGRVAIRPSGTKTTVQLDPDLASLALLNVLRNALQSTPTTGAIVVGVEHGPSSRGLVVEDGGPGIPPEILERLGEPFATTRATGTGIGLAVVRRVLEASHGRLDVRASTLGGARVELWFRHEIEAPESSG